MGGQVMKRNNHGSNANIGDYVRLCNAQGRNTDVYGIVYQIDAMKPVEGTKPKRFLWIHGQPAPVIDYLVNVVSRGDDNQEKSDIDIFGSDLADI
jgi:hypothetical protein